MSSRILSVADSSYITSKRFPSDNMCFTFVRELLPNEGIINSVLICQQKPALVFVYDHRNVRLVFEDRFFHLAFFDLVFFDGAGQGQFRAGDIDFFGEFS